MSNLIAGAVEAISLREKDTLLAKQSSDAISHFANIENHPLHLRLEDQQTGEEFQTTVPGVIVKLLADALAKMADGKTVTLVPIDAELSTQRAADIMGVSRPYFVKLLEQGQIPYRKVGEQRRVRYKDLLIYMETYQKEATEALDEIATELQGMNLYE